MDHESISLSWIECRHVVGDRVHLVFEDGRKVRLLDTSQDNGACRMPLSFFGHVGSCPSVTADPGGNVLNDRYIHMPGGDVVGRAGCGFAGNHPVIEIRVQLERDGLFLSQPRRP